MDANSNTTQTDARPELRQIIIVVGTASDGSPSMARVHFDHGVSKARVDALIAHLQVMAASL